MTGRDRAMALCAALPGAEVSEPFGPGTKVWKVGGRIFAILGANAGGLSVKCPDTDTAEMLRDASVGTKAPYLHRSWILLPLDGPDPDELLHRIGVSYDVIRAGLTRKVRATLPPRDTTAGG